MIGLLLIEFGGGELLDRCCEAACGVDLRSVVNGIEVGREVKVRNESEIIEDS